MLILMKDKKSKIRQGKLPTRSEKKFEKEIF